MKVYVDKNDLDFIEDSFFANNTKLISEFYHEESELEYDDCELLDLADYTKQVRKEVCEEIKKKADIEYYEEYDGFDRKVGKTYIIRDYDLDQIQGETK